MWQSQARGKFNKSDQSSARGQLTLRRVNAELRTGGFGPGAAPTQLPIRIILSEIRPSQVKLFAREAVGIGQTVAIALNAPESIYLKGRVVGCSFHGADTRIVSAEPHPWRVSVALEFSSEQERAQVEALCRRLEDPDSVAA